MQRNGIREQPEGAALRVALTRTLYSLGLYLLTPLVLARLGWLGFRHRGYWERIGERFGAVPRSPAGAPCLWVHAVSVGEALAGVPFIEAFQRRYPDWQVLVTTMTPTGAETVTRRLGGGVRHAYLPYDLPAAVRRFLDRARPAVLVLMETELWPNLLAACRGRGVPVILANARLSGRSAAGYRRFGLLTRDMLGGLTAIAAQTQADAGRFVGLGAPGERVTVTGSVKFDMVLPEDLAQQARNIRTLLNDTALPLQAEEGVNRGANTMTRPVWIAASTHEGEEALVLDAFAQVRRRHPRCLLVLAPRHPDRSSRIAELCAGRGLNVVRRSRGEPCKQATEVFLLDTLGELMGFYAAADVAFVGGSLTPNGGHNLLEPAAVGVAALSGPHTFNFAEIAALLREAGHTVVVESAGDLAEGVCRWLDDAAARCRAGECGRGVVEGNRGATRRLTDIVEKTLPKACSMG